MSPKFGMLCRFGGGYDAINHLCSSIPPEEDGNGISVVLAVLFLFSRFISFVNVKQNPFMSLLLSSLVRYKACRTVSSYQV